MVKKERYIPERGDIVWINFDQHHGHEQAHRRPALILSSRPYHEKSGLLVACPITSKAKGYPFEVALGQGKISGVVLANQIRTFDWRVRQMHFVQTLPLSVLAEVRECIIQVLTE